MVPGVTVSDLFWPVLFCIVGTVAPIPTVSGEAVGVLVVPEGDEPIDVDVLFEGVVVLPSASRVDCASGRCALTCNVGVGAIVVVGITLVVLFSVVLAGCVGSLLVEAVGIGLEGAVEPCVESRDGVTGVDPAGTRVVDSGRAGGGGGVVDVDCVFRFVTSAPTEIDVVVAVVVVLVLVVLVLVVVTAPGG